MVRLWFCCEKSSNLETQVESVTSNRGSLKDGPTRYMCPKTKYERLKWKFTGPERESQKGGQINDLTN